MASTVTSTPTDLTLTASFWNSSPTGTISWTAPTIPDGATIKSCVLTGKATASNTRVSSIKINNKSITVSTSGYNFTIDFGKDNSKTSVEASITKSGSSYQSCNVKFTNMTYTVTYELASVSYTVTFKDWDGSVLKTQTVASGGSATPPSNPTRDGYVFTGWDKSFTNITANTDIHAQYTIKTYTVRFLDWNGTVLDTQTINHGSNATPPPNPTRVGYTFSGWSGNYTNVTANVDIIAQYTKNSSGGEVDTSVKNIKIGNSTIDKLYLGTSQIVKVYLGNVLIFGGSSSGDSGGSGGEKNHSVQLDTVAKPSSGTLGINLEDTLTFSWDMSSIPSNATITKTTLMFDMTFNNFKAGSNELILEMRNYELDIAEDILGKDSGATRSFTYDCTSLGSNNSVVLDLTGYSISSFTYTISSAHYIVKYTV